MKGGVYRMLTINQMMTEGVDLTLVIRKANGQMAVSVLPKSNGLKDEAQNHIIPLTLKGVPQELDTGFLQAVARPVQKATGLITNMAQFEAQTYAAIVLAVVLHWFFTRTRAGLNLRAVGENPATADAAGINVTLYKYVATCTGAAICGVGGLYYVLDYNQGIWATTGQIEALGWLAVALVIFTTWKPLNAIWGAYLFGVLYWLYQFLPSLLGITVASYMTDLIQMLPYVVTIVVLIVVSLRKKKENQPPEHLGLSYFREER